MESQDIFCQELAEFVKNSVSSAELAKVFKALLTPAEVESIVQRLSIFDGLSRGVAQRAIAENLQVGIATVTRGSRAWQEYQRCLEKYFPRPMENTHA